MTESGYDLTKEPRFVVSIRPQSYEPLRLEIDRCRKIVDSSQIRFRGWYFPHIERDQVRVGPGGAYIVCETASATVGHAEQWRMYRSGQFVLREMLWEVPDEQVQERMRSSAGRLGSAMPRGLSKVLGFVEFRMLIALVSEAYHFASRLAQSVPYETAVQIEVGLRGVDKWALGSNEFGTYLDATYMAVYDSIRDERNVPLDILVGDPWTPAAAATRSLFEQFNWLGASLEMIKEHQRALCSPG